MILDSQSIKGVKMNTTVNPIFKKLLITAIIIFVAGVSYTLTNLCIKVSTLEHKMVHVAETNDINH
jgi:multisubunit Na+/H+ antiporter MnhC subunit